jgi:hypothetical protein
VPQPGVRVEVVRSGGFAGLRVSAVVDTATLPEREAQDLVRMVERIDLPALAARPPDARPAGRRGADRFQYDVDVERDGRHHRFVVRDGAVPAEVAPLLSSVLAHARGR